MTADCCWLTDLFRSRALELCQLTYQVGERRKIRHILRNAHTAGKFISWILPLMTILCLRIPSLKKNLVGYILVADLPCRYTAGTHPPIQCSPQTNEQQ